MQILKDRMVRMRDGVRLATDIYLPAVGAGPWPVVIERTPYDKSKPSRSERRLDGRHLSREDMALKLTERGFAAVFQDCRGRHGSEGHFIKYVNEGADGYDSLAWIVEQPWCDGRVGSMGLSYAAHTQLAMACLAPPGLCTMVLDSGGFADAYQCGIRQGGAFELKQATWAFKQAKESPAAKADPALRAALEAEDIHAWFARMPWRRGDSPLRHLPEYEDYLFEQWERGDFDSYWQQLGIYAKGFYSRIPDMPILFMSSWYDAYVSSTLDNYLGLSAVHESRHCLVMGPWLHGDRNISHSGNVEFGPAANFDGNVAGDWLACRIDWFETHLAGRPGAGLAAPVQVFLMGGGSGRRTAENRLDHGGKWIGAESWPLPGSRPLELYLTAAGELHEEPPAADGATLGYRFDPDDPVPTIGGALTSGAPVFAGGAFDQVDAPGFFGTRGTGRPLNERPDVLSFSTPPLEHDLLVAGPVTVELWVESDCPDTDFTAKLLDVYPPGADYPDGYAMNLSDGIFRCRYRNGWSEPTAIVPHQRFRVTIEPFATCNLFRKGHRLRLDISSSNFPRFDVNPNSGEAPGHARHKRVARNTLHLHADAASRLRLVVMPAEASPGHHLSRSACPQ